MRLTEWGPLAHCSSAVDTEDHEAGDPLVLLLIKSPHVCVTIVRTCEKSIGSVTPVDTGHNLRVLCKTQDIFRRFLPILLEFSTIRLVYVNLGAVGAQSYHGTVLVPCHTGDSPLRYTIHRGQQGTKHARNINSSAIDLLP
eukprot:932622-Amorphochlora_amoeboformis.AAC.1